MTHMQNNILLDDTNITTAVEWVNVLIRLIHQLFVFHCFYIFAHPISQKQPQWLYSLIGIVIVFLFYYVWFVFVFSKIYRSYAVPLTGLIHDPQTAWICSLLAMPQFFESGRCRLNSLHDETDFIFDAWFCVFLPGATASVSRKKNNCTVSFRSQGRMKNQTHDNIRLELWIASGSRSLSVQFDLRSRWPFALCQTISEVAMTYFYEKGKPLKGNISDRCFVEVAVRETRRCFCYLTVLNLELLFIGDYDQMVG